MSKALDMYAKTATVGPPDELNMDVGGTRGLFTTGRCALSMDWGDIGTLTPGTYAQDKTGATITPGWKEVLDRASGNSRRDGTTCPTPSTASTTPRSPRSAAGRAPSTRPPPRRTRTPPTTSVVHERPAQSGEDVTLGKTGYNPYRTSHFSNIQPWLDAGLSQAAAENYLGAIQSSLENTNMVLDMRIPLTKRYQQDVLDTAVSQYLAGELDAAAAGQAIADGWNAISDEAGREAQLAAYVASLGVQR